VDGTFWSDQEEGGRRKMIWVMCLLMEKMVVWRALNIPERICIHINNTNPILLRRSPERKMTSQAGIRVGYDGM